MAGRKDGTTKASALQKTKRKQAESLLKYKEKKQLRRFVKGTDLELWLSVQRRELTVESIDALYSSLDELRRRDLAKESTHSLRSNLIVFSTVLRALRSIEVQDRAQDPIDWSRVQEAEIMAGETKPVQGDSPC